MDVHAIESPTEDEATETRRMEARRPKSGIKLPLAQQQIYILKNALPADVDVNIVVSEIETLVKQVSPENLYQEISTMLGPLLGDKVRHILGVLFMYKKKPCREGNYCTKGMRCIFLHDKDIQKNNSVEMHTEKIKRKIILNDMKNNKRSVVRENREVIFNKVPMELANEEVISDYASRYGDVYEVKRLNDGKYLIRFEDHRAAQNLVNSQDPVLDTPSITKFFNVMPLRQEESLDFLFSSQQETLNSIYKFCSNKELFSKLKYLCLKIQKRIEEAIVDKKRENKEASSTVSNPYVNQFGPAQ